MSIKGGRTDRSPDRGLRSLGDDAGSGVIDKAVKDGADNTGEGQSCGQLNNNIRK